MRFWRILTLLLVVAVAGVNVWRSGADSLHWGRPAPGNPALDTATAMSALFATAFAWLTGALLTGLLWPRRGENALVLSIGAGVGLGLTALIFHFAALVSARPLLVAFPAELLLCCVLLFLWLRKMRIVPPPPAPARSARSWLGSLVRLAFFAAGGVALFSLAVTWRAMPAELCGRLQVTELPLVPAGMARAWAYLGTNSPFAAALHSVAFSAATAGLLVAGVHRLRNRLIALAGGLVLLATPAFSRFTAVGHADIPFGFYLLATTVLLSLARDEGDPGVLFLAGLSAGLAAWTKPEGLLLCLALGLVFGTVQLFARRWRNLPPLLGGLALTLIPLVVTKTMPPGASAGGVALLTDWSRHLLILQAAWRDLRHFGEWYSLPYFVLVLHLIGPGRGWLERRTVVAAAVLLTLLAAGYAAALTGPVDLQEYLAVTLARLLMQVWPTALFVWGLLAVRAAPAAGQTSPAAAAPDSPPSGRSA